RLVAGRGVEADRARDLRVDDPEVALRRGLDARRALAEPRGRAGRPQLLRRVHVRVCRDDALVRHGSASSREVLTDPARRVHPGQGVMLAISVESAWLPPLAASRMALATAAAILCLFCAMRTMPGIVFSCLAATLSAFKARFPWPAVSAAASFVRALAIGLRSLAASEGARSATLAPWIAASIVSIRQVTAAKLVFGVFLQPVVVSQLSSVQRSPSSHAWGVTHR